jgi:hypothetical protein
MVRQGIQRDRSYHESVVYMEGREREGGRLAISETGQRCGDYALTLADTLNRSVDSNY